VALLSNLEARSFINWQNENGRTPIYVAAREGHTDALKELIAAGCDMNLADKEGKQRSKSLRRMVMQASRS